MESGIYKWRNKVTGNVYIGQAQDLYRRQMDFLHFNAPYAGQLINEERQAFPSLEYWEYEVLVKCDKKDLNKEERHIMFEYKKQLGDRLLNISGIPQKETKKKKPEIPDIPIEIIIKQEFLQQIKDGYNFIQEFKNFVNFINDVSKNNFTDVRIIKIPCTLFTQKGMTTLTADEWFEKSEAIIFNSPYELLEKYNLDKESFRRILKIPAIHAKSGRMETLRNILYSRTKEDKESGFIVNVDKLFIESVREFMSEK